ncbi:MAG: CHAT domain-containing protein [Elusimicrobia bacterium]|nr:CHAT domain-containing protein [Elusimicrobiota bacterium]
MIAAPSEERLTVERFQEAELRRQASARLDAGARRLAAADRRGAVAQLEIGITLARKLGDPALTASMAASLGSAHDDLGDYETALRFYKEALGAAEDGEDRRVEADRLGDVGQEYLKLGDYDKAASYSAKAAALHRREKDARGEANDLNTLGLVHAYRGSFRKALDAYGAALATKRALRDGRGEAAVLANQGLAHEGLHEYAKALEAFERSLALATSLRDDSAVVAAVSHMAGVRLRLGDYAKALDGHRRALELARKSGDVRAEAAALADIGVDYHYLGEEEKALEAYTAAVAFDRKVGDRRLLALALNNVATAHAEQNDHAKARPLYEEAIRLGKELGMPMRTEELNLGASCLALGDVREAYRLFKLHKSHLYLGKHALATGDPKAAKREFQRALAGAEKSRDAEELVAGNLGLGLALEKRGETKEAREAFERAVAAIERQRELLPPSARKGFLTARAEDFPRLDAYAGRARTAVDAADGLFWSESTKARSFVETLSSRLGDRGSAIAPEAARAESELTERIAGLYLEQDAAFRAGDRAAYRDAESALKAAKAEQSSFITRLRAEHPAYAAVQYPEPIKPENVVLRPDEAIVEYEVTDTETLVFVLKKGEPPRSLRVPVTRAELRALVDSFRKPFERPLDNHGRFAGRFDDESGERLHELLLKPALALLPESTEVVVVPDETLGLLPFHALLKDSGPSLAYAQSATALTLSRTLRPGRPAQDGVLVLADPVFDAGDPRFVAASKPSRRSRAAETAPLMAAAMKRMGLEGESFPRLEETGSLARAIKKGFGKRAKLLVGPQASGRRLLREDLSTYRHLVFATHGILDSDVPYIREPALVLSRAQGADQGNSFLTMSQVMNLKLDAEIVALTACKTGLGKEVKGEGVLGLGRAFQHAGARNVLVTLWSVAEKSTTIMTRRFFERVRDGATPREALKGAQADVRKAGYTHPFFWAPFALMTE